MTEKIEEEELDKDLKACVEYDDYVLFPQKLIELFETNDMENYYKFKLRHLNTGELIEVTRHIWEQGVSRNTICQSFSRKCFKRKTLEEVGINKHFMLAICALLRIGKEYPDYEIVKVEILPGIQGEDLEEENDE